MLPESYYLQTRPFNKGHVALPKHTRDAPGCAGAGVAVEDVIGGLKTKRRPPTEAAIEKAIERTVLERQAQGRY